MSTEEQNFKVGDRVTRKAINNFSRAECNGTIIEITYDGRYKIKWDIKQKTGQQHSTIKSKFLEIANDDIF